ncbi:hypothetical protein M433DRAFT_63063 [Acidomyces richmondensis BFW]|nr:MAG: hypothetical protein FE78DRAFT_141774 [Acidomyces sp. 'richmondensis']KYG47427.1 hypothetical protein M433DRAFT_63063 [Acidomyces richmondensis BFW]
MPGNFHSIPESVLQSWPKPNYIDPVRRGWLPVFSCTWLGASTILIAVRFYMRARKEAGVFGLDDLLIFIGWFVSVGFTTTAVIDAKWYGIDVHTWDVRLDMYVDAALVGWIAQVLFLTSTCATKCSVLLFYRRLVKDIGRWIYAIWAALTFTGIYYVGILIAYCLACQPLEAYWKSYNLIHPYTHPYKCIDGNVLSPFVGTLSVISDIYAVILPMVVLRDYQLDVPRRQKIGLRIIFALGLLVAGAGIARTYYLWKINHTYDTSWTGFDLFAWSLVECQLAIICACAPSLRALLRRYFSGPFNRTWRSSSRQRRSQHLSKSNPHSSGARCSSIPPGFTMLEPGVKSNFSKEPIVEETVEDSSVVDNMAESARSHSSDTMPRIKTAHDYENFAMEQLSRHAYKPSTTTNGTNLDFADPRQRHDVDNAV